MSKITKKAYLSAVSQKLQRAKSYLVHGPLGPKNGVIRDELGVQVTFSNILDIAGNMFDNTGGEDAVATRIANFSGAGFADVSDVQTVGAIDVTIMTLANSLVPFLCVDRSMANPTDTIYYNNLVAVNSAGGLVAGAIAGPNFTPPINGITLSPGSKVSTPITGDGTTASSGTSVDFATLLIPGSVQVAVVNGGTTYTGKDFASDGKVYFSGLGTVGQVDYATGVITVNTLASGHVLTVAATEDVTADSDGSSILKVKADYVPTTLTTSPKTIILEQNAHSVAYMNKILANAKSVQTGGDYTNLHFQRVSNIYIEDVNRDLIKLLVQMAAGDTAVTLNLSTYGVDTFASTKDDLINRFIINMRTQFLAKTGIAPTVIVGGSKAVAELESNPNKWVPSANFYDQQNGLAGTFSGIPVFRHNYLDSIDTGNYANYYMAAKLPDNSSGSLVFGEYLPLVQTASVGNFNNPLQSSTGFFSQVGSKIIQSTLIKKGSIQYA